MRRWALLLPLLLAGFPRATLGDQFILTNGGQVEGEWLNPDESPRRLYHIRTMTGRMSLPADQVERVVEQSDLLRDYREFVAGMADTVENHWDVAQRCRDADLDEQRQFHLDRILELDPDHVGARHALGYSRVDERWVREEEWRRRRGYVRVGGGWRLAQEIELEAARKRYEEAEREWRQKTRRWRSWILRNRGRQHDGLREFAEIRDPTATIAIADLLDEREDPKELRLLYVDVLVRLDTVQGAQSMIRAVMEDPDEDVRDRCLDYLAENHRDAAVEFFVQNLNHRDNRMVNRAARALGRLGDPSAIPDLIDALTTEHRFLLGGGPGMSVGFGNNGVNGLSTGGGPKMVERDVNNPDVVTALSLLTPDGVNFRYNQEAWREWHVRRATPERVDLRRDQ